jgi:general secretion pathway protein E
MPGLRLTPKLPVTEAFKEEYLQFYRLLPLEIEGDTLRVACAGVPNVEAVEDLELSYGVPVTLVEVPEADLQEAIRQLFAASVSTVGMVRDLEGELGTVIEGGESPLADVRGLANQPPVIRYVNLLIREAADASASDLHLDATREGLRVRLRLDGVLTAWSAPPVAFQAAVVSRIKLLAELDIAERRAPQDGRIRIRLEARELDLRVATVPTLHGESVVLRLLDRGERQTGLGDLGLSSETLAAFERLIHHQHGILLATGPTGSGKTTTLYAALGLRDATAEKIITVEDPVEYHLPGVTQVPVHAKAGVTFAAALRSLLRQDPDVLMVGEMRDAETAGIAVQAAMTGHLVFSTLHTNDAVSAITRLADLGVEPYMIASSLEGILAQRLVRRICPECRTRYQPDPRAVALLSRQPVGEVTLERGAGCGHCRGTGYRGRTGIYELLPMTDDLRRMLVERPDAPRLRAVAQAGGMRTLREDGWIKVQAGITTVEEVLRVAGD